MAILPSSLTLTQNVRFPALSDRHRHALSTPMAWIFTAWGGWLEQAILPYLNNSLAVRHASVAPSNRKRYLPVTKEYLMAYFLAQMLRGLTVHKKHHIKETEIHAAGAGLCGVGRSSAIHAHLGFTDHILEDILASWPAYIKQFVLPGTLTCVDETIFPHYGKIASDHGKLQCIEGKPWDYGMVAYVGCQRLFWTGFPICFALRVNCLESRRTPTDIAIQLLTDVRPPDPEGSLTHCIVADSLWSQPATLTVFQQHHVGFLVAMKPDNGFVPSGLIALGGSDLPIHHARTYSDGTFTLQVTRSPNYTSAVLTDMWSTLHTPDAPHTRNISYESAAVLFAKESPASLASLLHLTGPDAQESKAAMIFKATGWDPLRPLSAQGAPGPLTYAKAKELKKAQLVPVYKARFPRSKNSSITKANMLAALFPDEAREAEHASEEREEAARRKRTRAQLNDLDGYRDQVCIFRIILYTACDLLKPQQIRGAHTPEGATHKLFDQHFNGVDRMNQDYHMFFQLRGFHNVNCWALHAAVFYFFATCRGLCEESVHISKYAHTHGAKSAWDDYSIDSLPRFILSIAQSFDRELLKPGH